MVITNTRWAYKNTFTSPKINGTVTTDGLTLPAFTAGADITLGANSIKDATYRLKFDAQGITSRNLADTAYAEVRGTNFRGEIFYVATQVASPVLQGSIDAASLEAKNTDANYFVFKARDTGVGQAEVARLLGADDPEFRIGNNGNAFRGSYAGYLAFYGTAPIAKPSAYTQTYATADKTHAAETSADFPAGGVGTAAGGWDTAANRDAAITRFNALRVDVADVKQLVNSIIDDLQALGLVA